MDKIFNYIDANKAQFIDNLAKAVEIKSVSAWPECRPEIVKMVIFEFISSNHFLKKSSFFGINFVKLSWKHFDFSVKLFNFTDAMFDISFMQVKWMGTELEKCGASIEYCDVGEQTLPDVKKIPLPPVLMGNLGSDPKKKTLLVYGHLDVQPAAKEDGWDYEPFVLTK